MAAPGLDQVVAAQGIAYNTTTSFLALVQPATATGIVVQTGIRDYTPAAEGQLVSATYGGVALTLVAQLATGGAGTGELSLGHWELLDLSACVGTDLVLVSGPASPTATLPNVAATFLLSSTIPVRVDIQQAATLGQSSATVSIDPGAYECLAVVCGGRSDFGDVTTANIEPYGSQIELSESASDGSVFSTSYLASISSPTTVGVQDGASAGRYATIGAAYRSPAPVIEPVVAGASVGIPAAHTVTQGPPVIWAHPGGIGGASVGIPAGFRVSAEGPAQVMLAVPGAERPQLTEGGTEGQVLTTHAASKPTWESPGTPTLDWAEDVDITTLAFGDAASAGATGEVPPGPHRHGMPADPVIAHVAAGDPHPGYLTPTEGDAAYSALGHTHADGSSPPALLVYLYGTFK